MSDAIELGLDTLKIEGNATELFKALAAAQAEFVPVAKLATGQVGKDRKFKYADYNTLTKCVRPHLTKHGIALIQPLHSRDGFAVTTTVIAGHGASIHSSLSFKAPAEPQEFGRHHTYYRRYQLQAMLGLAGDDDADEPPMAGVDHQEPASPPKAEPKASAAKAPAAAKASSKESTATPSVPQPSSSTPQPSAPVPTSTATTNGKADTRTMSEKLIDGMKQKQWKMADLKAFYVEHVDPAGFVKTDDVPKEKRELLWQKMIDVAGVIPF